MARGKTNGTNGTNNGGVEAAGDEASRLAKLEEENAELRARLEALDGKAPAAPKKKGLALANVSEEAVRILRGELAIMPVRLRGEALMVHRWGQKAIIEMLSKMTGHDLPQQKKDLTKEYEEAHYRNLRGEHVIPCRVIKACMVAGASTTQSAVKMSEIKQRVLVLGHTAVIRGGVEMDVRPVKVGPWNDRVVDLRARPLYTDWYTDIVLQFPHETVPAGKVILALNQAGAQIGLCEFRITQGGDLGRFTVEELPVEDIDRILEECASPEEKFEIPPELLQAANAYAADKDKRNGARKAVGLIKSVNGAEQRHADAAAAGTAAS